MSKRNRFDPEKATLKDALDRFQIANANGDAVMKATLFTAYPVLAALDFREVLVRAFGDTPASEVEQRLKAAMLQK